MKFFWKNRLSLRLENTRLFFSGKEKIEMKFKKKAFDVIATESDVQKTNAVYILENWFDMWMIKYLIVWNTINVYYLEIYDEEKVNYYLGKLVAVVENIAKKEKLQYIYFINIKWTENSQIFGDYYVGLIDDADWYPMLVKIRKMF